MYKVTKYPHGTFSWADSASTDAAKAKQFYLDLMGWSANDIPMGDDGFYTMFEKDGETVAGFSQMMPDMQAQGVPSHWMCYVTVDDVDALMAKVKDLGGNVLAEPFDVFDSGRMAVIQDPTGARVSLWQAKNHIGASLVNTVGAMLWNELMTRDKDKAMDFYGKLLGWTFRKDDNQDYHYILNNGRMNGGILSMTADMGDAPPGWMVYFNVADIDASVEKAKKLGGQVHVPIMEAPGVGRFSVIADPAGAVLTIMQANDIMPWEEN